MFGFTATALQREFHAISRSLQQSLLRYMDRPNVILIVIGFVIVQRNKVIQPKEYQRVLLLVLLVLLLLVL
jgi:hypothetical protein